MRENGKPEIPFRRLVLLSVIGAAALTVLLSTTILRSLFYTRNGEDINLVITNHGVKNAASTEEKPGTKLEIKMIQGIDWGAIPETEGWNIDGYGVSCERTEEPTSIVIPVKDCSYITMILVSYSSAGEITIQAGDTEETLDLYCPEWKRVVWNWEAPNTWSLWENRGDLLALYCLCLSVLLGACFFRRRFLDTTLAFQALYHAGFFAVFACIVALVFKKEMGEQPGRLLAVMFPFLAVHLLLGWWCQAKTKEGRLWSVGFVTMTIWDLLFAAGLFVMLQIQIYMGRQLAVDPGWDFGNVFYGALEIVEKGRLVDMNNYFLQCHNNTFAVLFLAAVFKVISVFRPVTIFTGIWLNVLLIDIAVVLIYLWMREVWTPRKALYGAVICFFLSPYYLFVPIFYTDTLSLPFAVGILWLYEWVRRREGNRKKALFGYGVLGAFCVAGGLLKGNLLVFAVAIGVHLLMRMWGKGGRETNGGISLRKRGAVYLGCFLIGMLSASLLWKTAVPATHIIDYEAREKYEFPAIQQLMMGAGGDGNWAAEDQVLATNTDNIAQRTQVCAHMLQNRVREKGFTGMLRHFINKGVKKTWGDGLYFTYEKLKRAPIYDSWLHDYVLETGSHFPDLVRWTSGFHIVMLLLMLLSIWKGMLSREVDQLSLVRLIVLGLMLFLFLWETRSRYLVNTTPLFAVMAVDGSCYGIEQIRKLMGKKGEKH